MKRLFSVPYLKSALLLLLAIGFVQTGLAQSGVVKRSWAFAKERTYGQELRDLEGRPVKRNDTAYFLYLETAGKGTPQIGSVTYKGRLYHAAVHSVPEKEIVSGIEKLTNKKFTLKKAAGTRLWLVELNPLEGTAPVQPHLSIKGKLGKQAFSLRFKEFVLLVPDDVG